MKATTKKAVAKQAQKAINSLKDLWEDPHTVPETRDAARGYLQVSILDAVQQIEGFIKAIK